MQIQELYYVVSPIYEGLYDFHQPFLKERDFSILIVLNEMDFKPKLIFQ